MNKALINKQVRANWSAKNRDRSDDTLIWRDQQRRQCGLSTRDFAAK